jgi:hypothetical protein
VNVLHTSQVARDIGNSIHFRWCAHKIGTLELPLYLDIDSCDQGEILRIENQRFMHLLCHAITFSYQVEWHNSPRGRHQVFFINTNDSQSWNDSKSLLINVVIVSVQVWIQGTHLAWPPLICNKSLTIHAVIADHIVHKILYWCDSAWGRPLVRVENLQDFNMTVFHWSDNTCRYRK